MITLAEPQFPPLWNGDHDPCSQDCAHLLIQPPSEFLARSLAQAERAHVPSPSPLLLRTSQTLPASLLSSTAVSGKALWTEPRK